jgi:asparagine synthase (glutamine-hydrolysing)
LSIIDLEGGAQPLGNEDGAIQVVFNGEIYNYRELMGELEAKGHRFRTRSDTEVLVHLYEEMGDALVDRLRGMFAFAIWDGRKRRLLLARDRLGLKPLYYYRDHQQLVFASEIKPLLLWPGVERTVDAEALEDYLAFGAVPGERSIFRGIRKLLPGHVLSVRQDDLRGEPRRYWQLKLEPDDSLSVADWLEAIKEKFHETVAAHLIADVPVGAFLSGGLDSSAVTAAAAQSQGQLQTFSIGFDDERFSELPYARSLARRFGTRHVEEIVTPQAAESLQDLVTYYDEPFADPSAIPTMCVAKLARQYVKVVLTGDGGDEAFGGYARYAHDLKEARIRRLLPRSVRRTMLASLARVWPKADWLPRQLRFKTALTNLSLDDSAAYANTISLCRPPFRRALLNADVRRELNGYVSTAQIEAAYANGGGDPLNGMISADVAMLLPDDFLTKVDRATMAFGVEARPPLVDHEFLELTARIPSKLKVRGGETKWIFKQLCDGWLPDDVVHRRKQGFDIPIDDWLRGPLREPFEANVLSKSAKVADLVDQRIARNLYEQHLSGRSRSGNILWALLVLGAWADRYLASPKTELIETAVV